MSVHERQQREPDKENCHKRHLEELVDYTKWFPFVKLFKVTDDPFGSSGPGTKTAAAAAGRSGPSCRPPWVTDPNFADRYRPDKTSTVVTQHQQPVQPTPMQNRSSILQAAQQAPEDSGRTPVCGACNKIIRWGDAALSTLTAWSFHVFALTVRWCVIYQNV